MESEDLPLLEMDEEDDFLIPDPKPTLSSKSSSFTHFTCSPLALPPSRTINYLQESRMDNVSSSSEASNHNKENINSKNVEVPKLGIKPLQMKTRKKGGGYNLRKSLAWDRAFFTDEGILDPLELTLITGINANTYIGGLPTISEEGNDSFSSDSRRRNDSSEEARLIELHANSCTTVEENAEKRSSAGNHDSLPHHNVTNKVLSINHTKRPVSKVVGCLKTLAASPSSLKRPAISNTLKTAKKESKLPKLPISKPQSCFSATTKGSLAPSQLRRNMIPKSTTNVQKNAGLKSSVKNVHDSQSKAKAGSGSLRLPTKELAKKTVRNLTNSSSKAASSSKLRLTQLEKASTGSEIVPDRLQFCEFQEESAPIAAENLAQHTATNLNKLLNDAARLTSLRPCHPQRASNELMISDKLHPCESQECPAAPQHINLHNTPINQPTRPSGLKMPSLSLRFFDQRTASESGSLLQKKTGSNRKFGEVRPPVAPRRVPMKSNDITEKTVSTLSTPSASTQLSPSPNYMANKLDTKDKFVLDNEVDIPQSHTAISVSTSGQSIHHQEHNFRAVVDDSTEFNPESRLDACRLELDVEEQVFVELQKDGIAKKEDEVDPGLENYSNLMQHEKIGQANNTAKVSDDKSLCMVDDARCNTDSSCIGNGDAIEQTNDDDADSVDVFPTRSFVRDVGTPVLNDYPSAEKYVEATTRVSALLNFQFCSKGQSVNCVVPAESSNLEKGPRANATEIDDDDDLFQEKSGLNHISAILMDVPEKKQDGVLIPGQPLEQVQLEFREAAPLTDDHSQCFRLQRPTVEVLSVGVDDAFLKTESPLQVAQCASTFSQCLEKERLDLVGATIESQVKFQEEINKSQEMGINIISFSDKSILDVKSHHSCSSIFEANPTVEGCTCESKSYSPFQNENQTLEGFGTISKFSKIHGEDTQVQLLENDILDHSCSRLTPELHNHSIQDVDHSNTAIELEVVNCVMPSESSNRETSPCVNVTEIDDDDLFQEKSVSNHISAILMDVSEKKQDEALIPGQPLEQVQLEFREVAPLTDDHNQSCGSCLLHLRPAVELLSVGEDDAFLKTESLLQVAQCANTFSQSSEKERLDLIGAAIESQVKIQEEIHKSQEMGINILSFSDKSRLDVKSHHSCGNISEANPAVEGCPCESKFYSPFQNENQTLEGFGTVSNFSKIHGEDTQVQFLENDILDTSCSRLTPEPHNHSIQDVDHNDTAIELEVVPESNHQLLTNTDNFQQLFVIVRNIVDGSDIYVCDPKPSNGGEEINSNGHLCDESGSTVIDSHNEKHVDTYNTVCTNLGVPSKLESSDIDEMVGVKTPYYSASFPIEIADSMLEKKRRMSGESFDIGQISVDNDGMFMNYNLSLEQNGNLDEADNALYGVIGVPEQSISHECDLQNSNACAQTNCMLFSDCNSSVPVSHHPSTGVETTSTTLCSVTAELCPVGVEEESLLASTYGIGADRSNIRLGQVIEEGKSPMVVDFHHQLDLEENKEATVLTKKSNNIRRQDNSLVIHPPNVVPFSDEWLAAIEAAGEEILTMKCGAVQHSPPDKSVPEPSPWSPVKKKSNQIGPYDCTKYTNALPSNPN